MAELSLRHIYKTYKSKDSVKKPLFRRLIDKIKRKGAEDAAKIRKRKGDFVAVKDFNMEIGDGEFIVFVGPSGCGKSTTLRMIAGLEEITSGELYIDGKLVNAVEPKDRDIAMVFQNYALYPHMTVAENIAFSLKMRRIPVPKLDKNGEPIYGPDRKLIRDLQAKLRGLQLDRRDAQLDEKRVAQLSAYISSLEGKRAALESVSSTDEADKAKTKRRIEEIDDKLDFARAELETASDFKERIEQIDSRAAAYETQLKEAESSPVQALDYKKMSKAEIDEKVAWAAKILGIEELLDSKPAAMSGGQRQRVALGRAIVRDPKVMLLDEPLSNLDAKLRATMRSEIVKIHNKLKTTFVYVTHDQVEAMTMGTRIVVMKLGIVQQIDTPTNLFDFPENKFVAGFIGTPQMNFFDVVIKKSGKKLTVKFTDSAVTEYSLAKLRTIDDSYLDGEEHEVTLGIRGEHMSVAADGVAFTLDSKEVLGSTTQMFVTLGGGEASYVVCVSGRSDASEGDVVKLAFDEKHIHMFDKVTERSIMTREYGN